MPIQEEIFRDHVAATSNMAISDPTVQKWVLQPRPVGTTFTVVSAKICRFSKTRFWRNPGAPPKNTKTRMGAAGLPPSTVLARHIADVSANNSSVAVVKDANLKMYHVMSVKQSLREDLAEHSYQFSCRAVVWSKMSFSHVPMQFELLELHVVDALGQQDVPDYFQQPAKAITEDVSVMRGPQAQEWIQLPVKKLSPLRS